MMLSAVGLILTLAFGILSASLPADAQPPANVRRIGILFPAELPSPEEPNSAAFRQALQNLGYLEGQTVAMEYRYALGRVGRFPELVAEPVRLKVDILVVGSTAAALAAKNATQTIPIVFIGGSDPVEHGLVASLARPGGNLTGVTFAFSEGFGGKWVELLVEVAPRVSRVAVLRHPTSPQSAAFEKDIPNAAQALGLTLRPIWVNEPDEFDSAFAMMTRERADALIVDSSVFLYTHHNRVVEFAAKHRLAAMYPFRAYVEAGGLMSYGLSIADLWRHAAVFVDKILKGAKPAEAAVVLSTEQSFPVWAAIGTSMRGWALAMQGHGEEGVAQVRQGIAAWRATGAALAVPYLCTLLAEVCDHLGHTEDGLQALAEAHTLVEQHEERSQEAEICRLRGVLLLQQLGAPPAEAEAYFQQALDIARRQEAKSLELRAAMSLSRLWRQQGKRAEARELLAPVYGWFTEGFDTADLQEAKALLQELA